MSASSNPYEAKSVTPHEDVPVPVVAIRFGADTEPKVLASAPSESSGVPDGPIKAVINWVGGDVSRAKTVLRAEKAGRGRKRIVTTLESIVTRDAKEKAR